MAENNCYSGGFREAVCIDAGRVYDSCCARDCLEDLRVYFTASGQEIINSATGVHVRNAEILKTYIEVEPVSFNKGYYACDLTFYFMIDLDVYMAAPSAPTTVRGIASFTKRVILFGSEGNAKIFSNVVTRENDFDRQLNEKTNMTRVVVQAVDPVALDVRMCEVKNCCDPQFSVPECICNYMGQNLKTDCCDGNMAVYVTLGLFTIVQLIRNVQMLVPVYDFCIPDKECGNNDERQPCDVFRHIKFPMSDFFPPCTCNGDETATSPCDNCEQE
jgi:hypothetical protein